MDAEGEKLTVRSLAAGDVQRPADDWDLPTCGFSFFYSFLFVRSARRRAA